MKTYEFDVGISLCKQDVEFAKKLISFLNPGLKVFFYEDNQEALITKSGPEAFAGIFKEKCRVVIILSRDDWSTSFYTEIEKNAIIDRISMRNEGFHFLFVIPMEPGQVPDWYPGTRIYADPRRFSVEQLAKFIEFKVTEQGGLVKPVTLEELHEQFLKKIEEKKRIVQLQEENQAIEAAKSELWKVQDIFNKKIENLKQANWAGSEYIPFSGLRTEAYIEMSNYRLNCEVSNPLNQFARVVTTQDFVVLFSLIQTTNDKKVVMQGDYLFLYDFQLNGWSRPTLYDCKPTQIEWQLLFSDRSGKNKYDLSSPETSEDLVDSWFQELFKLATLRLDKFL